MVRVGLVGCDSGHTVAFVPVLNHIGEDASQWVDGCTVVAAWPGESHPDDRERIARHVPMLRDMGVRITDTPDALRGCVDAVMVTSMRGCAHLEDARPFLEAGLPTYIDRHIADSYEAGLAIRDLAAEHDAPIFSASSLRFACELQSLRAREAETGAIVGALAYSGASLHPRNPGLYNYAVHAVETLYGLMGPGCVSVSCARTEGADLVTGVWADGRIGVVRGIRGGRGGFGFHVWCERAIEATQIATDLIYRELLQEVARFFVSGAAPVPLAESLEVMAFMDAAAASLAGGGAPGPVPGRSQS